MVTTQHQSKAVIQNIKKKRKQKSIVTTKPKWQTETQGQRDNGDIEPSENKR